jgi:23S rRNA pseudouridine2605 synthase
MKYKKEYPKEKNKKRRSPQRSEQKAGQSKVIAGDVKESLVRLNKYIANAGICSRREADKLIISGVIKVNGKVITDLGVKISPDDKVQYEDETIRSEKKYYVLLNKPKGYITTTDDPFDRKTVMFLVQNACKERIYPVGRLDRETTGVLLLTNDGDLAKKLTHPRHRVTKIYHVVLDKNLKGPDMQKIAKGIELEDGLIKINAISYAQGATSKNEIGLEIHSGKNRVIRRIFESLGYRVAKLDRVTFAGLTKKDIPRGKWRYLNEKEIGFLKMI